jgi:hypothetical protein
MDLRSPVGLILRRASLALGLVALIQLGCSENVPTHPEADIATPKAVIGERWTMSQSTTLNLSLKVRSGEEGTAKWRVFSRKELESLDEFRLKLSFSEATEVTEENGARSEKASPLVGESYVVDFKGEEFVFTRSSGASLTPIEEEAVGKDLGLLMMRATFTKLVTGRHVVANETFPVPADALGSLGFGITMEEMSLVFRHRRGDRAVFDVTARGAAENEKGTLTKLKLSGTVTFAATTGRMMDMSLGGPIELFGDTSGRGTIELRQKRE